MANVHNQTGHPLNYTFATPGGVGAVALGPWVPPGPPPVGVAAGIMAGPDHAAVIGVGGLGGFYPGIHMGNITVTVAGGLVAVAYAP